MTSEGLEEMFEGDSADMCAGNFRWYRWGPSGGSSVRRPEARTPIGACGNYLKLSDDPATHPYIVKMGIMGFKTHNIQHISYFY